MNDPDDVHVCLLRGVNVGGAGTRLAMAHFRAALVAAGCRNVVSHIQSGNAVFRSSVPPEELAAQISAALVLPNGTHPVVFVLPIGALKSANAANPFRMAAGPVNAVQFVFLDRDVMPDPARVAALLAQDEACHCAGRGIYIYAPSGVGRSKLAGALDRLVRPATFTARNVATINALISLGDTFGA